MKEEIEELADEIRKLRKEVKELRESGSGTHIHHHYAPLPVYVPQYPQPSYVPWWGTIAVGGVNCPNPTTTYGVVLNNTLPSASAQISLT